MQCRYALAISGAYMPLSGRKTHMKGIKKHFIQILLPAIMIIQVAVATSCGSRGHTSAPVDYPALAEIGDSLRAFNLAWVQNAVSERLTETTDSDEIYALLSDVMTCRYYLGDPDSTIALARRCLQYTSDDRSSSLRRDIRQRALRGLGAVYTQYYSQPDSAIHYHRIVLDETEPGDILSLLVNYGNLADAYKYAGDYVGSVGTYRQALLISDSLGIKTAGQIDLICGLAACYTDLRNFDESTVWWDKAAALWPVMNKAERSRYLNNRGSDYYYRQDYDRSLDLFLRLDSLCEGDPDMVWDRLLCHVNLADIYLKKGLPDMARPLIMETSEFFTEEQPNPAVISYIRTQEMDLARQEGDFARVDRLIRDNPVTEGIRPDQAVLRLDFLRRYYREKPDYRLAMEYEDKFRALDDSLRDERVRMKSAELRSRHERDETILRQRVTISEKETRLMRTYAIVAAAGLALILLICVVVAQRWQRRNESRRFHDNIVKMRMDNIRNRITPHFIYNALNHEILAREQGSATRMPVLVDLLRRGQMLASDFCIPLDEELKFIELYLDVESGVTGPIDYRLRVAEGIDLHSVMLPSMTIQIFVENAVKHAFRCMPEGLRRVLVIDVSHRDGRTFIEISNNGSSTAPVTPRDSTGTGMRVVFQTIHMLNEHNRDKIEIEIDRQPVAENDSVYIVRLSIPDSFDFGSSLNNSRS